MKVAISSNGKNLESTIDERFGRCRYFIILETDDMSFDVVDNTNAELTSSAGIQAASFVASTGAETVITGNCGPKAMQVFNATNIDIILGQYGVIKDVVEKFKRGELSPSTRGNVPGKSGAGQTASAPGVGQPGINVGGGRGRGGGGRGMGGGGGRGMGGGGRGMGMGGGRGMGRRCQRFYDAGSPGFQNTAGNLTREQELAQLQRQNDELKKQMEAIQSKMKSLEHELV
jgi:predicted Fe-Mo cluster-binding NifX family protein